MCIRFSTLRVLKVVSASVLVLGCGGNGDVSSGAGGAVSNVGGAPSMSGGNAATGGSSALGGTSGGSSSSSTGGNVAQPSGGISTSGGISNGTTGGVAVSGGNTATGGKAAGGNSATGGNASTGGAQALGGSLATGGNATTGGSLATGGSATTGGSAATGGSSSTFDFPATPNAWQPSAACVDEATRRVAAMTLAQKAGQMVQGDSANARPADVVTYGLGSILSGAGSDPTGGDTVDLWVSMVNGYLTQGQALGIPILYGIDAVHGNNNVSGAVIFPHNIGLGCTRDPALVEEIGHVTALETRGTGINWTFAPVIGPALDERWGRTYETFAETPELTAEMGLAAIRGLQGSSLSANTSVLACAKHFAGDGATDGGINEGNCTLPADEFKRVALDPYQPAINAGVGSIMVSFSSYNGTKMSANRALLTDTLKGTMGFRGFLVSDWAAAQKVPPTPTGLNRAPTATALATVVNAGLDMIMEPYAPATVRDLIVAAVAKTGTDQIPETRINDAVTRILTIKCEMGLFASGYSPVADSTLTSQIGSADHRSVARRAVRESLVLLQNTGNVLPLPKTAKVLLAGTAADNKAKQCGGWTIDWTGLAATSDTPATTIRQGIEAVVGAANVTYAATGSTTATGITHAIVVVGEAPYAETTGDKTDLSLAAASAADVTAIDNAVSLGVPTVVVVISGRPLIITDQLSKAGAWVAAWLPGTEGNGVADVLFGDYKPTGKLSHSWPKSMAQIPINVGDSDYTSDPPLFAYGFGLSY